MWIQDDVKLSQIVIESQATACGLLKLDLGNYYSISTMDATQTMQPNNPV